MDVKVKVHDDGSFDILAGDMKLLDCYPGIDGRPLRPVQVGVTRGKDYCEAVYTLDSRELGRSGDPRQVVVRIADRSDEAGGSGIAIATELRGFTAAPHSFYPFFQARAESLPSVYRQGFGIGAATGLIAASQLAQQPLGKAESYGLAVLGGGGQYLSCWADKQDTYIHRYDIQTLGGEEGGIVISAGFRMERTAAGGAAVCLPPIQLSGFTDLEQALSAAASSIGAAMEARTHRAPAYHWCSWYYWYHRFSHQLLREYLPAFSKLQPAVPLQSIQIDAGYFPSAGDWLESNELWPEGLGPAFADIADSGYTPGIWIAPFMVGSRSSLYRDHPEWVLHDLSGHPVIEWRCYNEPKAWGYADDEYYVLDTSHPEAMNYIRGVFRTFRSQGAQLFKTDFMLWGIQDSTKVSRHTPGLTSVQYFRQLLEAIREEIGEESYWIGCIAPFMPFIGYADAMRIGDDIGAEWNDRQFGPENMIRQISGCSYMNGLFWQNDPDAVLLRDFHIHMSGAELESLALLQAVSGGTIYTSDPLHELPPERIDLFRMIVPGERVVRARQPLLHEGRKELVLTHVWPEEGRALLLFFNPTSEPLTEQYDLEQLTGVKAWHVKLWKTKWDRDVRVEQLIVKLPPHGSRLYLATLSNTTVDDNSNLWAW
ncbi:glycoside hydrolase family 36 protein [Paenibacillus nasutitermitis]|uniref:Alpha-galactosidase n=1 Tax=Paenibacillus nasutitermitis TaxID=1652958 RepID=A0A916ZAU4_9BACL|nr:glycoside hydrolase family 36 protein [Paenibacillus nasutitermitis]GGD85009.1 hypothetical protein GCM10010911_49260 [Paenibacillus nasutitermitis]